MNSTNRIVIGVAGVLFLIAMASAQATSKPAGTQTGSYKIEETLKGPMDKHPANSVFSPDGSHVAYVAAKGDKEYVVVDGQAGPEFDGVSPLTFSPDSKRVGYLARKGEKYLVVVDGRVPCFRVVCGSMMFVRRVTIIAYHTRTSRPFAWAR